MPEAAHALHIQALGRDEAAAQGVRRLFHEVFGHEVSAAHWAWKYGPGADAQALHWVAVGPEGPDRPWGHVGARVMPGWWRGQPLRLAHLTDVMVHPRLRGNLQPDTVYARLMRTMAQSLMANEGQAPLLAWGFPGLTPARLGARMGLYRPLQRIALHHVQAGAPEPRRAPAFSIGRRQTCRVQAQDWDAAWLDRIWHGHAATSPATSPSIPTQPAGPQHLSVQKDAAYCLWRYRDHPAGHYRLWRVQGPWWRPLGWLITRSEPQPLVVDTLLPWPWRTGTAWSQVLQALARASGTAQWTTWNVPDPALTPFETETSLIVPVEFRAAELAGGGPSAWTAASQAGAATAQPPALSSRVVPASIQPPWFQPGDTDVF